MVLYNPGKLIIKEDDHMKKKYYLNIANGSIVDENTADTNANFAFYADEGDLNQVREKLENMDGASRGSYLRAHIPYYPEMDTPENAKYDKNLKELYSLLYKLGDEQAKEHIQSLDIIDKPGDHLV